LLQKASPEALGYTFIQIPDDDKSVKMHSELKINV